jgi:hypothetical protein
MRTATVMMLAVMLGACTGGSAPAPPPATPVSKPASELAVAEPYTPPPAAPPGAHNRTSIDLGRSPILLGHFGGAVLLGDDTSGIAKRSDLWDPCVREFVQTRDPAVRNVLGDALSQYPTSCGNPEHRLKVLAPLRTYRQGSYVALVGSLGPKTNDISLLVDHYGAMLDAERITIITDGAKWTSARLDFEANVVDHREAASVPYTSTVARLVERMLDTKDAVIRFEGPRGTDELIVTDDMKRDLQGMLDVLDALSPP